MIVSSGPAAVGSADRAQVQESDKDVRVAEATRILVVDDEDALRNFIRINLELEGYRVSEAADGDAGFAAVRDNPPDLVLLDVQLPKTSGWEVLTQLRREPKMCRIPVVMLTAHADEASEWRARDLGSVAYVAKPVGATDLLATIRRVLQGLHE